MSIFNQANKALDEALSKKKALSFDNDRSLLLKSVGTDLAKVLEPLLQDTLNRVIDRQVINVEPAQVTVPTPIVNVSSPDVIVPEPRVTVNVPKQDYPAFPKIPDLKWPDGDMPITGWVSLMGVDLQNPLPVQIRDANGRPVDLSGGSVVSGGGSGGRNYITVSKMLDSTGTPYSTANPMPVTVTSGGTATSASAIIDSTGVQYSGSNPLPVTITSGGTATSASNIVDSSGIAYSGSNPVPITWISGAGTSTQVNISDSSGVGYSGSNPIPVTMVTGVSASVNAAIIDSAGNYRDTFPVYLNASNATSSMNVSLVGSDNLAFTTSRPVPVTMVTGVSATVASANIDSTGVQYSGSNPMPTYLVANGTSSTVVVGTTVADAVDDGSRPVQTGGIARTVNPTAVSGNDVVKSTYDDLGRQVMRTHNVRDLIQTAYVSVSNGTETTLKAADAGFYNDLIYVLASNNSTAAVGIDLRAVSAGNIQLHLEVPANGTVGVSLPVALPGMLTDGTGNAWTVDLPDITGTTAYVSALFTKEV